MSRTIVHPKMLQTMAGRMGPLRQALATVTNPGATTHTADGGQAAGTATTLPMPVFIGQPSYQARVGIFGEEAAAYVQLVAFLPTGTEVRDGWLVTIERRTYSVVQPQQSIIPGAPMHVGLSDRRPLPSKARGGPAL